jgi:sRNA-binding regulator protein Hfq
MRITNTLLLLLSAAVLFSLAHTAAAQIQPGRYQIVGAFNSGDAGFHGRVHIRKAGPVTVRLNNGAQLRGRVDARGNFVVTSARSGRQRINARGSVSMRNRSYAVSRNFWVRNVGNGIFMMGRI